MARSKDPRIGAPRKTVLVTGAASGLGLATVERLASGGAQVLIGARDASRGEAAHLRVVDATGNQNVHVVVGDLSSQAAEVQMADEIRSRFERVDVQPGQKVGIKRYG